MTIRLAFIVVFCALTSKGVKAQNSHWQPMFPTWLFSYSAQWFYEDTTANLLYMAGGSPNGSDGVAIYDGDTVSAIGSLPPPCMRRVIKYNDTLYASGVCQSVGLVKWNGSTWDTTGLSVNGSVWAMHVYNGELYVGGVFSEIGNINAACLAKYDGTSWSNVGNLPVSYMYGVYAITSYNNELYIGGQFEDSATNTRNILRWNGSQWNTVGGGFHGGWDEVACFEVWNNILYIGGAFTIWDGNVGNYMAQWDGTTLSDVGGGLAGFGNGQVHDLLVFNNELYAAGVFSFAGGVFADRIAKWDGTNWCGFGDTLNNSIMAIGTYNNELYMGGSWWIIGNDTLSGMAKWIGGNYVDTCGNTTSINEQAVGTPAISVFPNPTSGTTTFQFTSTTENATLHLHDALGRETWNQAVNSKEIIFQASEHPAGIYFYRLEQNGEIKATGKLIIQ